MFLARRCRFYLSTVIVRFSGVIIPIPILLTKYVSIFSWLSAHFCVCLPKSPFSACCASVFSTVVSSVLSIALFAPTMLSTYRTMHTRAWTSLPYAISPYVLPPECSPVANCFRYICHTDPSHIAFPLSILHVSGKSERVPMSQSDLRTCNICPASVSPLAVALRYVFSTIGRGPASVVHSGTKTTDPSRCPSSLFSVICILGPGSRSSFAPLRLSAGCSPQFEPESSKFVSQSLHQRE
jgi:hypothetical protein